MFRGRRHIQVPLLLFFQELKRERTKAAAAIKAIQERMEDKLKTEIEQKVCTLHGKLRIIVYGDLESYS